MDTVCFEIAAFAISTFCLLYSIIKWRGKYTPPKGLYAKITSQHYIFLALLENVILSSFCSVVGYFLEKNAGPQNVVIQFLFHELYYIFHTALGVAFLLYIMNVNGANLGKSRRFYLILLLPFIFSELLVLTNPFTGFVFYIDEAYIYHRGSLIVLQYAIGIFYVILGIYYFIKNKAAIPMADLVSVGMVLFVAVVGLGVQAAVYGMLVELFFESIAFLSLMVQIENRADESDPVTGAGSRASFVRICQKLLETHNSYSIIGIGLNNLDLYSRTFSGQDLDEILRHVFENLEKVHASEMIFHFRDKYFALVVYGKSREEAEELGQKLMGEFNKGWKYKDVTVRLEACITVIHVPEDADSLHGITSLLTANPRLLNSGSYLCVGDSVQSLKRDLKIDEAIRNAIKERTLKVYYQPIWSAETKKIIAAEALVRLFDPELGHVSSEEFIPMAEKAGLISDIGSLVFEETCDFIRRSKIEELGIKYIEVNLSVYQFIEDGIVEYLDGIRKKAGLRPSQINLEITESASSDLAPTLHEKIAQLNKLGYSFSLDDFGTGYSNLERLISNRYMNVKMDKTILWDADRSDETAELLDSLIRVVRSIGMNLIQEGVENEAQLQRVLSSGCNLVQGYYFSKPLPEDEFLSYVANMNK